MVMLVIGMFEFSDYIVIVWFMMFGVNCCGGCFVLSVLVVMGCSVNLVNK